MKHGERFEQRWEFRRKEVDGDTSSDENGSNSINDPANTNRKLVTELILVESDDDDKVEKTKKESKKKQGLQRKKKPEGRTVNENKRKREVENNKTTTLKDLKKFGNSLIHELSVTRENMFAHMRDEMRKLSSPKSPIKTSVRRSQKNEPRKANKQQKDDESRPSPVVHMNDIPLLKPEFQIQRNGAHLNDHIPKVNSSSEIEIGKLMAGKRFSHRVGEYQPQEWFNVGFVGQSGLAVPFIRGARNGANASGLTNCDTSFADSGVRMNGRFPTY